MTKLQKLICINIVAAQIASDAGKGIYDIDFNHLNIKSFKMAEKFAYDVKPGFILKAIEIINSNPQCGINYYVSADEDQNGYDSVIVYFDIKINDERFQVSFHTPLNKADDLIRLVGTGRKTRWRRIVGSRESCQKLICYLCEVASPR